MNCTYSFIVCIKTEDVYMDIVANVDMKIQLQKLHAKEIVNGILI